MPISEAFRRLFAHYGPQSWWPGESRDEIVIGAILTQNTNWKNVERAIAALRETGLIDLARIRELSVEELAEFIRPSGCYRVKARRLLDTAGTILDHNLGGMPTDEARKLLLATNGIGPETADSILLYAYSRPIFVVDAYTRRIFERIGIIPAGSGYARIQGVFMDAFSPDVAMFNEYHALIVRLGKDVCRPKPICDACELRALCRHSGQAREAA
jgi:endonuclease III related protein